jgi:hypothetical protein
VSHIVGLPVLIQIPGLGPGEVPEPVPDGDGLAAAAAMARCHMAPRLRGSELKALLRILDMTAQGLSVAMGGDPAGETIQRWANETKTIGGHADKLIRLLVCERLRARAPAIGGGPLALIGLKLTEPEADIAPMEFRRLSVKVGRSSQQMWALASIAFRWPGQRT